MNAVLEADVASALRLRRWALPLLSLPPAAVTAAHWAAAPAADERAWRRFLSAERCTLPLMARLAGAETLPRPVMGVLRSALHAESSRVLGVRAQLLRLARIAGENDWPVVVLKSGASLAVGTESLDLVDLDVLVPHDVAEPLRRALLARGYRKISEDTDQHLGGLLWEGTANVEIHFAARALNDYPGAIGRSVPAPLDPRLLVLHPLDHAWQVLHHAVYAHPSRRGALRDLVLLSSAVDGFTDGDLEALGERAQRDATLWPVYRRVLGQAVRMSRGAPLPDDFVVEAACRLMAVRGGADPREPWPLRNSVERATFGLASRSPVLRDGFRHAFAPGEGMVAALRNLYPPVGRVASGASRLALLAMALPIARLRVARARRAVQRAEGERPPLTPGQAPWAPAG